MNNQMDILSLTFDELENELVNLGEQKFRAKQIFEWLHVKKVTEFHQMNNVSAQLKSKLQDKFCINLLNIKKKLVSTIDDTVKYLYLLSDSEQLETVMMHYKHGNSLCISTQVGCKMKCAFCASGIAGFVRNLTAGEMLEQVYFTERESGYRVDSIVLMGIGEPLDNYDNVLKFLNIISDDRGRNMSLRHISVSTCGLVDKIRELAELRLGITLSVSLHASNDQTRSKIMPINSKYPINELINACGDYFKKTGRRISFEFALIEGVNDSTETADELISLIRPLGAHINLIPVNNVREAGFKKSNFIKDFKRHLLDGGINATVRRTLGSDIEAACGQLRRDNL